MALRLPQRVSGAVHVFQAVDERAREAEKRIGPLRPQLRRFTKRGHRRRELLLRRGGLPAGLLCLAIDAMDVSVAITQRCPELTIVRRHGNSPRECFARETPLRLSNRRRW